MDGGNEVIGPHLFIDHSTNYKSISSYPQTLEKCIGELVARVRLQASAIHTCLYF